jgi:hypothetical protein
MKQETKDKISAALKGRMPKFIPDNRGRTRSPELRAKISATLKRKGIKPPSRKGIINENALIRQPGYLSFLEKRRETRKRTNGGSFTFIEWEELKNNCQYTCQRCLKSEPEIKLTVDHIVPISKNGQDSIDNIQPLCTLCNMIKQTKIQKWIWGDEVS